MGKSDSFVDALLDAGATRVQRSLRTTTHTRRVDTHRIAAALITDEHRSEQDPSPGPEDYKKFKFYLSRFENCRPYSLVPALVSLPLLSTLRSAAGYDYSDNRENQS